MKTKLIFITILLSIYYQFSFSQIVLPWSEGFENVGTVKTYTSSVDSINGLYDWSFEQSTTGQVRFNSGSGFYHSGNSAATLGTSTDGSGDISKLILELDLSLYRNSTDLELCFYYMDHGDVSNSTDAVYIKSGTSDYISIFSLNPGLRTDGTYTYVNIDLDQEVADAGLKIGSEVFIKFSVNSKYRTYSTTNQGGITFDDISITGSLPPVLLPWIEGFEGIKDDLTITSNKSNINGRGNLSYQKSLNGRLRFNAGAGFYRSGSRAATFDCDAYNALNPQNMMILTLNMSRYVDYDDLELGFSYMQHGEESHLFDKVYIRGASSNTWVEAYDLYANRAAAGTWKDVVDIDIDSLLLAAGQTISSTFQIAFSQQDDYPVTSLTAQDGITLDDIKITTNDRYWVGTHSVYLDDNESWYPLIGAGAFSYPDSIIRSIILAEAERMPITREYCMSMYFETLIIEENAELLVFRDVTVIHQIVIENDFIINGCLKNYDYYPGSYIYVYGDLIVNGSVITPGGFQNGSKFVLYGNFYNNGYFDPRNRGISFYGSNKRVIGGNAAIGMKSMCISVYNSDYNAVEFTNSSNELNVDWLMIEKGCFEINSNANLKIGYLYMLEGTGLNLNDGNISFILTRRLQNFNTSVSITNGISSSVTNNFYLDFEDNGDYNWLMFGNGTHAGTQLYNVRIMNTLGEIEPKFVLKSDMLVQNNLYLDGAIIVTDTNEVIIQSTAPSAIQSHGESSYINGNLRRYVSTGSYDFPVGSDTHYQLVNVDISSTSGGLTYLDAKFTSTSEERPPEGLEVNGSEITEFLNSGYWTFTPNAGSAEYDITLVSRGHSNGGFDPAQHAVFKRSGVGDWESLGSHDNATQSGSESDPISATRSSLTGFSDFIIGKNDIPFPLPVELTSFTAECRGDEVILSWQTESELNNDGFSVEKSNNGVDFYQIAFMPGCGNCNNLSKYEMVDEKNEENAYYRLKQIDYDGAFSYSDIVSSSCGANRNDILSSINEGMLIVDFSSCNKNQYQLELYDNSGKMVFRNLIPDDYNQHYNFYLPSLSSGIYYLNIYNINEFYSQKVNINIF
jgi:hypothetical protein